jgi:hypothetical protein
MASERTWVTLYLAAAETCDQIERAGERRSGDALAPARLIESLDRVPGPHHGVGTHHTSRRLDFLSGLGR